MKFIYGVLAILALSAGSISADHFGLEWIQIPSGEFQVDFSYYMKFHGGKNCTKDDPQCRVKVKVSSFYITKKPISRSLWMKVMGKEKFAPWEKEEKPNCPDCFAYGLNYSETETFIKKLSELDGKKQDQYRFPTESEMILIASRCKSPCGVLKSLSSSFYSDVPGGYINTTGYFMDKEINSAYIWTGDNSGNEYLQHILKKGKLSIVIENPSPPLDPRFNYGKIQISFFPGEDGKSLQINRLGHSKNMVPSERTTLIRIVKDSK